MKSRLKKDFCFLNKRINKHSNSDKGLVAELYKKESEGRRRAGSIESSSPSEQHFEVESVVSFGGKVISRKAKNTHQVSMFRPKFHSSFKSSKTHESSNSYNSGRFNNPDGFNNADEEQVQPDNGSISSSSGSEIGTTLLRQGRNAK
jgi:hypothetical protein